MKAVLFDMDGVLIDSERFYMKGTLEWMNELGFKGTYEDVCSIIGTTMLKTYQMCAKMLDNRYTIEELAAINEKYFLVDHPLDYSTIAKVGSIELLKYCKSVGLKVALCSSSSLVNINAAVDGCGFRPYLDFIVSGEQFEKSKPNPEIYIHAAAELNVMIKECVVIEDSLYGIEAGKAAGMIVIALNDECIPNKQDEADYIINHLIEAKELIEKWV